MNMNPWLVLMAAILLEVAGTTCMKLSDGLSKPGYSVLVFAFYGLSLAALTIAIKKIDLAIAYAIWAGLGTVLITLVGYAAFKQPITLAKLSFIALIMIGVVGLHLSGESSSQ